MGFWASDAAGANVRQSKDSPIVCDIELRAWRADFKISKFTYYLRQFSIFVLGFHVPDRGSASGSFSYLRFFAISLPTRLLRSLTDSGCFRRICQRVELEYR